VDINDAILQMESAIKMVTGEYISLMTSFQDDVWPVKASAEAIEQIVINLVANASEAMPDGGILEIRTRNVPGSEAGHEQPCVMIEVCDDGCGMDSVTKMRIFEPFFSKKPHHEGAGLGLSVVHSIVVQLRGRIQVYSEPRGGSIFQVYLPRYEQQNPSAASAPGQLGNSAKGSVAPVVLVVEGDDKVRDLITSTLRVKGYSVLEASDGREALEVASQNINDISVIITELTSWEVTGPELATRISLLRPDIKIVYVSSQPKPAGSNGNGSQPKRTLLFKPVSPREVLDRVESLLHEGSQKA
jgi:CheY-like chemotaxis protein